MRNDPYRSSQQQIDDSNQPLFNNYKATPYNNIQRGTTVKIPVTVRTAEGAAIDLTGYTVYFTMKDSRGDNSFDDRTALITRDFEAQDPTNGKFFVILTAKETWLNPGFYFFDFELEKDSAVVRLGNFSTQIIEGVTNRSIISSTTSESLISILDDIIINQGTADNIIVISNFTGGGGEFPEIPQGTNKQYVRARNSYGDAVWIEISGAEGSYF